MKQNQGLTCTTVRRGEQDHTSYLSLFTQTPKFLPKFFHLKELKSAAKAASRQNSIYKLIPRSSNSHIYLML